MSLSVSPFNKQWGNQLLLPWIKTPFLLQTHSFIERNDLKYNQINSYDWYDKNEEVLDELKIVIIKIYQTNQYDSFT